MRSYIIMFYHLHMSGRLRWLSINIMLYTVQCVIFLIMIVVPQKQCLCHVNRSNSMELYCSCICFTQSQQISQGCSPYTYPVSLCQYYCTKQYNDSTLYDLSRTPYLVYKYVKVPYRGIPLIR